MRISPTVDVLFAEPLEDQVVPLSPCANTGQPDDVPVVVGGVVACGAAVLKRCSVDFEGRTRNVCCGGCQRPSTATISPLSPRTKLHLLLPPFGRTFRNQNRNQDPQETTTAPVGAVL